MVDRRVVIGKYNDGINFGIRCSLAGNDALTGDSSGGGFSFDSNWSDILKPFSVGKSFWAANSIPLLPSGFADGFLVTWPSQGFIPFVELRRVSGTTVNDDYFNATGTQANGYPYSITTTGTKAFESSTSDFLIFVVYKLAVPSG